LILSAFGAHSQTKSSAIAVGFVSLTTTQAAKTEGRAEQFAPNLLVRFQKVQGSANVMAMTDQSGTAIVPLEPGEYCVSTFGLDGKPVLVSKRSQQREHRCFSIKSGTTIEFSVALASNASYSRSIPSLPVQ
jgi:hypothetical protein